MVPLRLASSMTVVVALAACERADREGPKQVRLPQPRVATTLVSPGSEPRKPLRYIGNETVVFERALDIRDRTPSGYVDHPITRERFESRVVGIRDGEVHYRIHLLAVSATPRGSGAPVDDEWTRVVKSFEGSVTDSWADDRGIPTRGAMLVVAPGATVDTANLDLPGEEMMVVPVEPVGVGATWEVSITTPTSEVTSKVELTAMRDEIAELRVSTETTKRLHGMTERGSGTTEWTLDPRGTRTTVYGVFRVVFDESEIERHVQLAITPVSRESRTSPSPPSPSAP